METTLEVRWFGPGRPPDVLATRFDELRAPAPQRRTDTYVLLPGGAALGVKLRDGRVAFELKLRSQDLGDTTWAGGTTGRLERWQKWSLPIDDAACRAAGLGLPAGSLVGVEKHRRLVTFQLAPDGSVDVVDERVGDGCSVEVTSLLAKGSEWWSVGFEAFGTEDRLAGALAAAAGAFFSESGTCAALAGARSCAYPAWLLEIT